MEIDEKKIRSDFFSELEKETGENLKSCYQCGKCSASCPVNYAMDILPHQLIRMLHLGLQDTVLSSKTIWLCASCQTCTTRCPQGVDLASVMDFLRINLKNKKLKAAEKEPDLFNKVFIGLIKRFGRMYELGLIIVFNILSGHLFKDAALGPIMFSKGKIKLFPKIINKRKILKNITKNL